MFLFQLVETVERGLAQIRGAVGRAHDRAVQGGDDIFARVATQDFPHHHPGDFLWRDELHLAQGGDGREFPRGKEAVFAGVDVDRLQHAVLRFAEVALGHQVGRVVHVDRLFGRAIDQAEGLPAPADGPVPDFLPANHGRGLHFLDHRGAAGRAGHEEGEQGLRPGHGRFGHEHPRGLLFAVGVGDVEAHAAGAAGAHFDIGLSARVARGFVEDLDVAHQLGDVEGGEQAFHFLMPVHLALGGIHLGLQLPRGAVNILIRHGGGGVHAVDDDVGRFAAQVVALPGDQLV